MALSQVLRDSWPVSPRSQHLRSSWFWLVFPYSLKFLYIIFFPSYCLIGVSQYMYIKKKIVKSCEMCG